MLHLCRMIRSVAILLIFSFILAGLAFPAIAQAQPIRLDNLVVDNQQGEITVRFGLTLEDEVVVQDALKEGATLELSCNAELLRKRSYWLSADVYEGEYLAYLSYDPLKQEYTLFVPGSEDTYTNGELIPLLHKHWQEISLELGEWDVLTKGSTYSIDLSIRLRPTDVPSWIKTVLFFWSWDTVPPTKYTLDFTY